MKTRAIFYVVIAGLLWGSSGIFSNLLFPYGFSSLQLTATRGIVSGIAIALYVLFDNKSLYRITLRQFILFAAAGVAVFCSAAFYYAAIKASSVSTAAVLMYTSPAFVMTYSVAFLGERLTLRKLLCVAAMLLGCMLVSGLLTGLQFNLWGVVFGISSGLSYSAYCVLAKVEAMRGYHPLSATLYHFIIMGCIGLFFLDFPSYAACVAKSPLATVPLLIGLGLCTCVIPYLVFTLSLQHLPAGTASALGIIEPVAATLYSVLFFREQLSASAVVGIILVLGSCLLLGTAKDAPSKVKSP